MDEQTFLRILRDEPDNDEVRSAYWQWLEETGDNRAECVRLMRQRLKLQEEIEEIDARVESHTSRIGNDWLDIVFPLRIRSSMVGRCYTKPDPDVPPFVGVGDCVTPDKIVCVIEAMSVFNEIKAGVQGLVTEIAVASGDPVEYNQVLFRVSRPPNPWGDW